MSTTPPPTGPAPPDPPRSRRKISLPWFRQSSMSTPHAVLSRQHTIDTPSSFHARLLKGGRQRQAVPETQMSWVVAEHAAASAGEMSVSKGQQVELVEPWAARSDWWVVRSVGGGAGAGAGEAAQGAVPVHVLKPQPHTQPPAPHAHRKTSPSPSPSRRQLAQPDEPLDASSDATGSVSAASPGKRRGFSGRRWLGLKGKQSQGKADKTPASGQSPASTDKPTPLKKTPSDKKLRLPYMSGEGRDGREESVEGASCSAAALDEAEDDVPDLELPPPMKPIQDPQSVLQQAPAPAAAAPATRNSLAMDSLDSNGGPADIAEIEQIVKEKMEQHGGGGGSTGAMGVHGVLDEEPPPTPPTPHTPHTPGPDDVEAILKKRDYVLRELVDTEEIYVSDLRLICEGYIRHMADPSAEPALPESLRDRRHRMIFGNIEAIFEWHRDKFYRELEVCVEKPELLGPLFRRFLEKRMFMYEAYCRNKPVSEYIVSEHDQYFQELRQKLNHKLQLGDLLIKPIQRIQKYHLLVKKILSYTQSANQPPEVLAELEDAVLCTSIIPKNANDMMDVGRLQGFTGNITAQGKLLMQDHMAVSEAAADKSKELHVFLFEQCVIFSEPVGKRSQFVSPTYNYKAHVQVNKMEVEEVESSGAFIIHSVDPNKPRQSFVCRAPEPRRAQWASTLAAILRSQRMFGEALENPAAYLRDLHRDLRRDPAAMGEGWSALRKTESVPPCVGGRMAAEMRARSQRPHAKANTINLPPTPASPPAPTAPAATADRNKHAPAVSPTSPHANGLSKRAWGLKLRRGGSGGGGGGGGEPSAEGVVTELRAPELLEPAADATAAPGSSATIACRANATRATAAWRKTAPETRALRHGGRFAISFASDGLATLTIHACRASDAGVYCCLVSNELGGVQSSARLTVGAGGVPGVPAVRAHPGGGLVVQWDEPAPAHLEYCRVGEGEWRRATDTPAAAGTLALEELPAGQYSFRLVSVRGGAAGGASAAAACGGGGAWQREQFARRYALEEELGRGRTARVLAARDTGTGHRVALKQVVGGRGADAVREYRILSRGAHAAVVRALALFAEVPRAGAHTLVLELVGGGPLLEWAAAEPAAPAAGPPRYTQRAVAHHTRSLLSALDWLHCNRVAHLDVRPENILVEVGGAQPQLKLVDLGSALETGAGAGGAEAGCARDVLPPAPAQLEFAPPECVLGRPPTAAWDAWAAGVFLYVFLTGLSPFLDESVEETTANIIKCDYCFPAEHWAGVAAGAQELIRGLLAPAPAQRTQPRAALDHPWLREAPATPLSASQLQTFLDRRRPAGHGNALHSLRSPDDT